MAKLVNMTPKFAIAVPHLKGHGDTRDCRGSEGTEERWRLLTYVVHIPGFEGKKKFVCLKCGLLALHSKSRFSLEEHFCGFGCVGGWFGLVGGSARSPAPPPPPSVPPSPWIRTSLGDD